MKLQISHISNPKSQQISWRKGKEDKELTLFIKKTQEHLLKLDKFHVLNGRNGRMMKKDDDRWRGEQSMKKKSHGKSPENSRPITHINFSFVSNYPYALHVIIIFQENPWDFYLINLILISIIFHITPS